MQRRVLKGAFSETTFVGREQPLAVLEDALRATEGGQPRMVLVVGEAGTGKTALWRHFLELHGGLRVVEVQATEDEHLVAWGIVQLLVRKLAAGSGRALPAERTVAEVTEVGGRVLAALASVGSSDEVTVLVVDDAQWADRPSLQALAFALRRLEADRILTVVAARPPLLPGGGVARLVEAGRAVKVALAGLTAREVQELLDLAGQPISLAAASRLVGHTGGLPLHVVTLLDELDPATLSRSSGPLPAPRSFSTVVLEHLARTSPGTESLITAAAVVGESCPVGLAASVGGVADPVGAMDEAVRAGLVECRRDPVGADELRFVHSLIRAAVLDALAPGRRTELHVRAAEQLEGSARLEHRAAAALVSDEELAGELSRLGREEVGRGATDLGVHHLLEAARLTARPSDARRLRLDALEALVLDGAMAAANGLAEDIDLASFGDDDPLVAYVRGHLALVNGQRDEAERWLKQAWDLADPDIEPRRAGTTALRLAQLVGIFSPDGRQNEARTWAELALTLAGSHSEFGQPISGILAVALVMTGRAEEAARRALPDRHTDAALAAGYHDEVLARGMVRLWTDELDSARTDLATVAYPEAWSEPLQTRLFGLAFLADAEFRIGRWDDATAAAELGVSLAEDADHVWLLGVLNGLAALPKAARGQWDEAVRHVEAARLAAALIGDVTDLAFWAAAEASLGAARGDPEAVIAATEVVASLEQSKGALEPGVFFWPAQRIEALAITGRFEAATALLHTAYALAEAQGRASTLVTLARARGTLEAARGSPEAAIAAFEAGLALSGVGLPFEAALLDLAYGTHLRRQGARREGAARLGAAHDAFSKLDAQVYAQRAETELAACGLNPRRRQAGPPTLTAREQAVARLVGEGLSNPEIAARLFLSVKTVEYHLGNAYAKMGVRNRAQLVGRLQPQGFDTKN